jgi:hypothetical protein
MHESEHNQAATAGGYDCPVARKPQGRFLGIPYNWSRFTRPEIWKGIWDPSDRRLIRPKVYGWGWGVNFAAIVRWFTRR